MLQIDAEGIPAYGTNGMPRATIEVKILTRLRNASQMTSTVAKNLLQDSTYTISDSIRKQFQDAYKSWFKYWAWQHAYLNEIRRVDLPPLPTTPADELTKDGYRQELECMSSNMIGEIARMYFLCHLGNQLSTWSLSETR